MTNDTINGAFELLGGLLLLLNTRRLWKDRFTAGVSPWPVVFFASWGLWHLWFYCTVLCPVSLFCGIIPVLANTAWLALYLWCVREDRRYRGRKIMSESVVPFRNNKDWEQYL